MGTRRRRPSVMIWAWTSALLRSCVGSVLWTGVCSEAKDPRQGYLDPGSFAMRDACLQDVCCEHAWLD